MRSDFPASENVVRDHCSGCRSVTPPKLFGEKKCWIFGDEIEHSIDICQLAHTSAIVAADNIFDDHSTGGCPIAFPQVRPGVAVACRKKEHSVDIRERLRSIRSGTESIFNNHRPGIRPIAFP